MEITLKNNTTELVFIIDQSGSMADLASDTVGGFNSMLKKQKEQNGECFVSTVLFDNESKVLHDRKKLAAVPAMRGQDYNPGGCTALLDAIGGAIHHIGNIHKYARLEDVPAQTLFVIITDGLENASHRYSSKEVKAMIERQKEQYGWEFMFLGANIDAVETARDYGIAPERAATYRADAEGTANIYGNVSEAICMMRETRKLGVKWKKSIEEDTNNRK